MTEPVEAPQEEAPVVVKRTARVRMREDVVGWTTVLANVAVPITLGLAVWGLMQENLRERSNASQRQVELFYTANLGEAQRVLFALWSDTDLTVLRDARRRSLIDAFVERSISTGDQNPNEVKAAIVNLASYFDRVETCIESGRCDEAEIVAQLGQYGRDFFCIYAGQIAQMRQDSLVLSLGLGLERFTDRMGGCVARVDG